MNRRSFTAACGTALIAPSAALAVTPRPSSTTGRNTLPLLDNGFSSDLFEAYRGEEFRLSGIGRPPAAVMLKEVMKESVPGPLEQFSLHFEPVQGEMPAEDGLLLLEHPQGGKIALSLQPVTVDGSVRSLTASFSLIG